MSLLGRLGRATRMPRTRLPSLAASPLARRAYSTKSDGGSAVGPFTWQAGALFGVTAVGLAFYFRHEKEKAEAARKELTKTRTESYGKPKVGGPFSLVDQDGVRRTQADFANQWTLVYFGFTHCPDICPEELDKMSDVVSAIDDDSSSTAVPLTPIFITCDPRRDTVPQVAAYVREFHPRLIGLTGTEEEISLACRAYRVYHSIPPNTLPGEDYLVDHSIFFYLMHPDGSFADAYGKDQTASVVTRSIRKHQADWAASH